MQAWEEKELERQEAYADGEREGEARINKLYQGLIEKNRLEDMRRASADDAYREELLKEFGL